LSFPQEKIPQLQKISLRETLFAKCKPPISGLHCYFVTSILGATPLPTRKNNDEI